MTDKTPENIKAEEAKAKAEANTPENEIKETGTGEVNADAKARKNHAETIEISGAGYPKPNDDVLAARTRHGGTMWRGGIQFTNSFRIVHKADLTNPRDFVRIMTEPHLEVRDIVLQTLDYDEDVPQ